ncbi:hypothetical protein Sta7437_2214 [Stanieria cyanosphaera PCC 7437]|uniref:Nucleic acid binding OB-fold tRNA/helicase-type n=1 Tax=Stanieria cyanosphaera (strain ATCC 29371 / PCC 7437) TaxID=111780 RepID=K9XVR2_STAC7|nr:hypothetical protein [Stanieria cyanosphaera]AFZ35762.1 hypothetical protein Sta7437_2214 [Stanieria cyanosphaera PCC 7437]
MKKINISAKSGLCLLAIIALPLTSSAYFSNAIAQENELMYSTKEVENVSDNVDQLLGQTVTIRGSIEKVMSEKAFILENKPFPQDVVDEDRVLIINTSDSSIPGLPEEDDKLQVTGTVGKFVLADVEQKYGLDLDDELYVDYENKPVIFANYVALSPEPREITGEPDYYYDKSVAVKGEVSKVLGTNTFTIGQGEVIDSVDQLVGEDNLLVLNQSGQPIPAEDKDIIVTGVVRPFILKELEREYELTEDLSVKQKLEQEYSEKPILIINRIYLSEE